MAFEELRYGLLGSLWPRTVLGGDEPEGGQELPEPLIEATVQVALRIARDRVPPAQVLSRSAARLVRHALRSMGEGW
jgi:hypothetical protein